MSQLILEGFEKAISTLSEEENKTILKDLFTAVGKQHTSPAMSANQLGIDSRVLVCTAREPLYLINPKILQMEQPFVYMEAHSSFPNRLWSTLRYASIIIEATNLKEPVRFGLKPESFNKLFIDGKLNMIAIQHPVIMECCYIQQCIDTLDGITPQMREPKVIQPIKKDNEPNRNEMVELIKDDKIIKIKYKKISNYLSDGWILKN